MDQTLTAGVEDNLLEVIARSLPGLRKSDRRVAETILAAPEAAVAMTLATLARAAAVSEPTVMRFSNAVGCEGFRDLRVKLARSLAFARTTSHAAIGPTDDLAHIIGKVFDFNLANITWTRANLDPAAVAAAVAALAGAPRIAFFGMGASAIVALDAARDFQRLLILVLLRRGAVVIRHGDDDFRHVAGGAFGGAGEDHVVHAGRAHRLV
jgi:RpiR family carbohydrate utilization transcriptional regulator